MDTVERDIIELSREIVTLITFCFNRNEHDCCASEGLEDASVYSTMWV